MAEHVCPWWVGYLLASPLRRLLQDPVKILGPYVRPGMTVLDVGCGMGFFTLPLAEMVGPGGRVVAVDLQPEMIRGLRRRAEKAALEDRIEMRLCSRHALGLEDLAGTVDFALAFNVVHEVPDPEGFLAEMAGLVRPGGGSFLLVEPRGHVSSAAFARTEAACLRAGFVVAGRPGIRRSLTLLLERP